jgi:hypothetical protein
MGVEEVDRKQHQHTLDTLASIASSNLIVHTTYSGREATTSDVNLKSLIGSIHATEGSSPNASAKALGSFGTSMSASSAKAVGNQLKTLSEA